MSLPRGYAAFTRPLADMESDELFAAASAVRALADHPGYEVLQRLVAGRIDLLTARLRHGPIVTQAEYARDTGMASGLEQTLCVVDAVLHAAEQTRVKLEDALAAQEA